MCLGLPRQHVWRLAGGSRQGASPAAAGGDVDVHVVGVADLVLLLHLGQQPLRYLHLTTFQFLQESQVFSLLIMFTCFLYNLSVEFYPRHMTEQDE